MSSRDYADYVKVDELPALASKLLDAGMPKWLVSVMLDTTRPYWTWPRLKEGPLGGLSMYLIVDRATCCSTHHEAAIKALGLPPLPHRRFVGGCGAS